MAQYLSTLMATKVHALTLTDVAKSWQKREKDIKKIKTFLRYHNWVSGKNQKSFGTQMWLQAAAKTKLFFCVWNLSKGGK
jgi:hypothetical protein